MSFPLFVHEERNIVQLFLQHSNIRPSYSDILIAKLRPGQVSAISGLMQIESVLMSSAC